MMHTPKTSLMPRTHALLVLALLTAAVSTGCTRGKYYLQADREVSTLLAEKSCDPRWAVPVSYNVRQDERSRFYDAYNQVFPPMPPDDPTSHRYMHCIDGKWGFPRWHINGDRTTLDNPAWRTRVHEVANITESGAVVLDSAATTRHTATEGHSIRWVRPPVGRRPPDWKLAATSPLQAKQLSAFLTRLSGSSRGQTNTRMFQSSTSTWSSRCCGMPAAPSPWRP